MEMVADPKFSRWKEDFQRLNAKLVDVYKEIKK